MAIKNLYRGVFAIKTEIKREYEAAYSVTQAKKLMVDKMAEKQGVLPSVIWNWLEDHPNSYEIKLEIEWKEKEDVD
jgi:hypothetical protein